MTTERLQARQATIDELSTFIDSSHTHLDELLDQLHWSKEEIASENEKKMKICPIDSHHLVNETSLEQHTHECQLVDEGYSRQEQKEIPRSHSFFYENASSVVPVLIDKEAQRDILSRVSGLPESSLDKDVPLTVDRMDKAFTSAEKLAIHLAVLEKSKATDKEGPTSLQELEFDPDALLQKDETKKPKSRMEILAELRDYKRRRQSYRAKNVHITRRSQTEIMREVIEAQMSEIQQAMQGDNGSLKSSEHRGQSSSPSRSQSRDVSRSPIHSRSRQDDNRNDNRNEYRREHGSSKHSSYDLDYPVGRGNPRSRDSSRSPGPSRSRHEGNRYKDRHHREGDVHESPRIKIEKAERSPSLESSQNPGCSKDENRDPPRITLPGGGEVQHIKVEKGEESGHRSPSQNSGEEKEHGGSRRHHHSKHKHHHKHRHHGRDTR